MLNIQVPVKPYYYCQEDTHNISRSSSTHSSQSSSASDGIGASLAYSPSSSSVCSNTDSPNKDYTPAAAAIPQNEELEPSLNYVFGNKAHDFYYNYSNQHQIMQNYYQYPMSQHYSQLDDSNYYSRNNSIVNADVSLNESIKMNQSRMPYYQMNKCPVQISKSVVKASSLKFSIDSILGLNDNANNQNNAVEDAKLQAEQIEDNVKVTKKRKARNSNGRSTSNLSANDNKRIRTIFTQEQLDKLEIEFNRQQYMVGSERSYLANSLNLSESQVKIWFQNRRIKWRKASTSTSNGGNKQTDDDLNDSYTNDSEYDE